VCGIWAVVVDDIEQANAELRAHGVELLSEFLPGEPEHRVGRLVFFRDPDGNLLELYEA
jgi:catechol 2,3-dioxygenase-like lactoylglutathione lyase family enzyme